MQNLRLLLCLHPTNIKSFSNILSRIYIARDKYCQKVFLFEKPNIFYHNYFVWYYNDTAFYLNKHTDVFLRTYLQILFLLILNYFITSKMWRVSFFAPFRKSKTTWPVESFGKEIFIKDKRTHHPNYACLKNLNQLNRHLAA